MILKVTKKQSFTLVFMRKKYVSVNCTGHDRDASFF